jgi:cell division protein FtsI (penicillin-binding protein 3)
VLSPENAELILHLMRNIVESPHGTTRRAFVEDFPIAAKSGTAQIINPENGEYYKDRFTASVLSIFPADDPKLIAYVVLINPKGDSYYGGRIISPIIKEIALEMAPYYNIPLQGSQVIEHSGRINLDPPEPLTASDVVPNFVGLPKRAVLPFFGETGINPSFKGEGRVIFQIPDAGTPLDGLEEIFLEFQ